LSQRLKKKTNLCPSTRAIGASEDLLGQRFLVEICRLEACPVEERRKIMMYECGNVLEVDRASHQLFLTFMARFTQFEEMGKLGSQLLVGFHQELELFRRPPLSESSQVLANIIEHNQSERLRTYSEAGCRHFHVDQEVTVKSQELLKDLEHLVENATVMMQEATNTMLKNIKIYTEENSTEGSLGIESEEEIISDDHKLEISDYVAMMSVICSMLRQDYAMQEKVVSDLQLNTPSETLQSYSLMWTLHPFIDERIINKALTWV